MIGDPSLQVAEWLAIRLLRAELHGKLRLSSRSAQEHDQLTRDGQGNLTQRDYQGDNLAGPDFAPKGRETGTYQVNSDCTGSMVINLNVPNVPAGLSSGVIEIKFVISDGGRHIHEVVSENTPPGSTGPLHPTQTSADDWKVASEQDR